MKIIGNKSFRLRTALVITIVIALIIAGYLYFKEDPPANNPASNNTPVTKAENKVSQPPVQPQQVAKWQTVTSGKKAFIVKIPDGWKITSLAGKDSIFAEPNETSISYSENQPATIDTNESVGNDLPVRFSIYATTGETQILRGDKTTFGPVSGVTGERYHYIQDKESSPFDLKVGDQEYTYIFILGAKKYVAYYRIDANDASRLDIIEQVIKTMQFN